MTDPRSAEWAEQPKYMKILQTLLKEREMSFEQLVNLIHNRTGTRHRLDALISGGFMEDRRAQPRKGETARFMLTLNGQEVAVKAVAKDILKSLGYLDGLLSALCKPSEISRLRKWLLESRDSLYWGAVAELDKGVSWDEVIKHVEKAGANIGLLTKILRELQQLYVRVELPDSMQDKDVFIGFPKFMKGCPVWIPTVDAEEERRQSQDQLRRTQKALRNGVEKLAKKRTDSTVL